MGRKNTILVHARIRPPGSNPAMAHAGNARDFYDIDYNDNRVVFRMPKSSPSHRSEYAFAFDHVYDAESTQEEVYERTARPLVDDFVAGYNATVFCFGQTGSGKSYTMTGGSGSYGDRGIIPRALEQVYGFLQESGASARVYEVWLSYVQIYNETGYDLLGIPGEQGPQLRDLPRVSLLEDADGQIHVRGLSAHKSESIEQSLNILWNGDLNRVIAATTQNQASSRSHCIFTVHIRSRDPASDVVRQSKFNFVDLAGSERVSKTNADGATLQQARYINQSLFFLEQVIHALGRGDRGGRARDPDHVPYRNSMLTMFLRDAVGGNCRTLMLATLAVERQNLGETISTAQFAMSVGEIENVASVNEDVDPRLLIRRLKAENRALKEELKLLKEGTGANAARSLTDEDRAYVEERLREYMRDGSVPTLDVGSWVRLQYALQLLRARGLEQGSGPNPNPGAAPAPAPAPASAESPDTRREVDRLRRLLQQRDAEIEILTNMVGGSALPESRPASGPAPAGDAGQRCVRATAATAGPMYDYDNLENDYSMAGPSQEPGQGQELEMEMEPEHTHHGAAKEGGRSERSGSRGEPQSQSQSQSQRFSDRPADALPAAPAPAPSTRPGYDNEPIGPCDAGRSADRSADAVLRRAAVLSSPLNYSTLDAKTLTLRDLKNEQTLFERFLRGYYLNDRLAEDKAALRAQYARAKQLAATVTSAKDRADATKRQILDIVERTGRETDETDLLKQELSQVLGDYRRAVDDLRGLKVSIEAIEADLSHAKREVKGDFVRWYTAVAKAVAERERRTQDAAASYTGNADIDSDIRAFYNAKQSMDMR